MYKMIIISGSVFQEFMFIMLGTSTIVAMSENEVNKFQPTRKIFIIWNLWAGEINLTLRLTFPFYSYLKTVILRFIKIHIELVLSLIENTVPRFFILKLRSLKLNRKIYYAVCSYMCHIIWTQTYLLHELIDVFTRQSSGTLARFIWITNLANLF
jgi:hypothetical protein